MFETSLSFNIHILFTIIGFYIIWNYCVLYKDKLYKSNYKINQTIYQGCYYSFISILAIVILYQDEYSVLENLDFCASYDITSMKGVNTFSLASYYYATIIGWYIVNIVILLLEKYYYQVAQKDCWQMILHHFIIVPIIYCGCHMGIALIGIWILLLHDISDALLHIAKFCKHCNCEIAANIVFVLFAISFAICRFYLLLSYTYSAYTTLLQCKEMYYYLYAYFIVTCILTILNIFWFYLIVRIIYQALKGKELEDIRDECDQDINNNNKLE